MNLTKGGTITSATTEAAKHASQEKDRSTYYYPDHTVKEPRVLIFSRTNPGPEDNAVQRVSIKLVSGDRNSDDTPKSGNIIWELTGRIPQDQDAALAKSALVRLIGVGRDTTITDDLIDMGLIPTSA